MTVGIAAITEGDKFIVVACDRMLSHGDIIQATDNAALKARRIAKSWGATFAGEANKFLPILRKSITALYDNYESCSEEQVRNTITTAYRQEFEESLVSNFLSRLGYASVAGFKERGLNEVGEKVFQDLLTKIETADLNISILVYGFDEIETPHLFEISNPGVYTNHDLMKCAAIGSGIYMATAALRRRPPRGNLETTIYRVLEAKFSSETATGVGRATTLLTIDANGKSFFMEESEIETIRQAWAEATQQPDPKAAIDFLKKTNIANKLREAPEPSRPTSAGADVAKT